MKSLLVALVATSMFAARPHGRPPNAAAAARSRIQHNVVLLNTATRKRDVAGIMALMDPQFTQRSLRGVTIRYAAIKAMLQAQFHEVRAVTTCTSRLTSFKFQGVRALTDMSQQIAGTINLPAGTPGFKPGRQPFSGSTVQRIEWVKRGAEWKVLSSVMLRQQIKVSGKSIPTG